MGLGAAADFSLKEARERARAARQLLSDGIDPIEHRLQQRDAQRKDEAARITLKQAMAKFLEAHADLWRSHKHRTQWQTAVKRYAGSLLDRPVQAIDMAVINEALAVSAGAGLHGRATRTPGRRRTGIGVLSLVRESHQRSAGRSMERDRPRPAHVRKAV